MGKESKAVGVVLVDDMAAQFTLATGEVIRISLDDEGPLGASPHMRLIVNSDRSGFLIEGSSSNQAVIYTRKSMLKIEEQTVTAVAERDASKGKK